MDEATARARIEQMTAWDQDPVLSSDEVDDLVALAARADSGGYVPSDAAWTGTYDLVAAAAEGWLWKAGKVSGTFDFVTDGQRFNRSQRHEMCMSMHEHYRRRILTSPRIATARGIALDYLEAPIP